MEVKQLFDKLSKPYWTPLPAKSYMANASGLQWATAQLNLAWVIAGRPVIGQQFFITHLDSWTAAHYIVTSECDGAIVAETLTCLSPGEFHKWLSKHPYHFEKFYTMPKWGKFFAFASAKHV